MILEVTFLFVALTGGSCSVVIPTDDCCYHKIVNGVSYTLYSVGQGSLPYECYNDCVYYKDDTPSEKFCFAMGGYPSECSASGNPIPIPKDCDEAAELFAESFLPIIAGGGGCADNITDPNAVLQCVIDFVKSKNGAKTTLTCLCDLISELNLPSAIKEALEKACKALTTSCDKDQGVFLAGGRVTIANKTEAFYNPITNTFCNLPALNIPRQGSVTFSFTVCGGVDLNTGVNNRTCETFDPQYGTWSFSHTLDVDRTYAVAWESSQETFILGGEGQSLTSSKLSGGAGFDLYKPSYFSCGIPDHKTDSIYILGGQSPTNYTSQLDFVTKYDAYGNYEVLPPLKYARKYLGCTSYYDDQNNLVLLAVGGRNNTISSVTQTTEKFVVGVDTEWTVVDDSYGSEDNSCVNPNCQPFCLQGLTSDLIVKYNFTSDNWDEVLSAGYKRAYYGNFASVVPIDSGVENWCVPETAKSYGEIGFKNAPRFD